MNSSSNGSPPGTRWIVTTCRDRLDHLRVSLPSWLERCPDWTPIIVCCDDPAAQAYAAGELMLAGRGVVASTKQDGYFDKVEAARIGIAFAAGIMLENADYEGPPNAFNHMGKASWTAMLALLDADTVATERTQPMLNSIPEGGAAICGYGQRDDLGFLLAPTGQVWQGIQQIPKGAIRGYGPDDVTLRIAVWSQRKRPFTLLPAYWARISHKDTRRVAHFGIGMKASVRSNRTVQDAVMRRLVAPEDLAQCKAEALQWPKRLCDYGRTT